MELTSTNKLRIAAVAALGIVVLGILAWPLAAPLDPEAPVRAANLGPGGMITLLVLAFGLGFVGYFIAWPHGREIGILTVPFGLVVWAARSGPMSLLLGSFRQPHEREALALSLRFEPFFWLLVVAAGFAGVLSAQYLRRPSQTAVDPPASDYRNVNTYLTRLLALVATVLIAHFFLGVFVQGVATSHNNISTQPAIGQILFGIFSAFAVVSFLLKKFANLSYLWPAAGAAFLIGFAQVLHGNARTLGQFAETRPATFFPDSGLAILPVQLIALGALGSVLGYWIAVRYDWWRKNEAAG
jgi:hypothetical protein